MSGKWRLVWSQQAANASPLQKFGSSQSDSWQIIDAAAGMLQVRACWFQPFVESATRTLQEFGCFQRSRSGLLKPLPARCRCEALGPSISQILQRMFRSRQSLPVAPLRRDPGSNILS